MREHRMTAEEFREEQESFAELQKAQIELSTALNALGGRCGDGLRDNFSHFSCAYVNRAADGFVLLRNADRIDSAKLLIRPAIEAIFRLMAVDAQPDLLFRIAYTERLENLKWYRPVAQRHGKPFDESAEVKDWLKFRDAYAAAFPTHILAEKALNLLDTAKAAGVGAEAFYDTHYRLYCKFAHAALAASTGGLNDLTPADTRTMLLCTTVALRFVKDVASRSSPSPL